MRSTSAAVETLNDVHSRLNSTRASRCWRPTSEREVIDIVRRARTARRSIAVAGGRHAMGGQQFLTDGWVIDMRGLGRLTHFDLESGCIEAQAGIRWPELMRRYIAAQSARPRQWGLRQKQTGADNLTLGGAIAANIHGADSSSRRCRWTSNRRACCCRAARSSTAIAGRRARSSVA